jgi:hypothetical protein
LFAVFTPGLPLLFVLLVAAKNDVISKFQPGHAFAGAWHVRPQFLPGDAT